MKTRILTLLCCLLSLTAFCTDIKQSYHKEKTITKTFPVSKETELKIDNQFGNITIVEWDKNEIDISVYITASSDVEAVTQEQLDGISVKFNASGSNISAQTTIENVKYRGNKSMQIDYTVKIPSYISLHLNNTYGNVTLDQTHKPFYANVQFGNLQANRLMNEQSQIEVQYGDARIKEADKLHAKISFGSIDLQKASGLVLTSSYSKITIGKVNDLIGNSQFDNPYYIEEVNNIIFQQANYTNITIGRLEAALKAQHTTFGKLNIKEASHKLREVIVSASYSDVNIKLAPQLAFSVDLSMTYGNIKLGKEINQSDINYEKSEYGDSVQVTGKVGKTPQASIRITNSFSSIKLDM